MGRRFGQGLWLADTLDEAVAQIETICRAVGYRHRDVHVWRDGTVPNFWVSRPNGQGGIGAQTMAEAERIRTQVGPVMGVLVIRRDGVQQAITRGEARQLAS